MRGGFVIEPLGAHDRSAFSCDAATLDRYFREQASQQDVKRLGASCFVAVETATNTIAGYDTRGDKRSGERSAGEETETPPALSNPAGGARRSSRRRPALHGKGLGSAMLVDGALRARKSETKVLAGIVDAKDENAITFCRSCCLSEPQRKGPRARNHNGLAPLPIPSSFEEGVRAALLRLKAGDAGGYDRDPFVAFPNANGERAPNANACQLEGHTGSLRIRLRWRGRTSGLSVQTVRQGLLTFRALR